MSLKACCACETKARVSHKGDLHGILSLMFAIVQDYG